MKKFKIITLKSAIDIWERKEVKDIFFKLVQMKKDGYKNGFKEKHHVLPFDGTDFISTHQVICYENQSELIPLLAYKSCNMNDCIKYNIPFTALSAVKSSNSSKHISAVEELLENVQKSNLNIAYDSSLTVNPIINEDPELALEVFSIFMGTSVLYKNEEGLDQTLMLANLSFKTDKTFKKMGSTPLSYNGVELSSIICPYLGFSEMKIFLCVGDHSKKAISLSKKYEGLWLSRTVLSPEEKLDKFLSA